MKLLSLALLSLTLSLSGCAVSKTPATPPFEAPASCLEAADPLPAIKADIIESYEDVVVLYTKVAVLRNQCRAALIQ